jgi:hypothetical protein
MSEATLKALVPMAHVQSVTRSIEFYARLGFTVQNTVVPDGAEEPVWAWVVSGGAQLMLARADGPVDPAEQAVLFYLYSPDLEAYRAGLVAGGVPAGTIKYPFYAPRGEFRVEDPDGYVLMVAHA